MMNSKMIKNENNEKREVYFKLYFAILPNQYEESRGYLFTHFECTEIVTIEVTNLLNLNRILQKQWHYKIHFNFSALSN